jgi:hypothetical protein
MTMASLVFVVGMAVAVTPRDTLPPNIVVAPELRDVVSHMLRESRTFRAQCKLIGRQPRVQVRIVLEDRPAGVRADAQTNLSHYEFGRLAALVRVWSRADAAELIAHELEHVIEASEGINYRALALLQPGSVWTGADGTFETTRAINAGQRAKLDLWRSSTRLAIAAVERRPSMSAGPSTRPPGI